MHDTQLYADESWTKDVCFEPCWTVLLKICRCWNFVAGCWNGRIHWREGKPCKKLSTRKIQLPVVSWMLGQFDTGDCRTAGSHTCQRCPGNINFSSQSCTSSQEGWSHFPSRWQPHAGQACMWCSPKKHISDDSHLQSMHLLHWEELEQRRGAHVQYCFWNLLICFGRAILDADQFHPNAILVH